MWPWEHLAFGYLLYSLSVHAVDGRSPDGRSVVVLAVATQVPDLVDKTLAWVFDVFTVGYAAGHSVLVVGPLLGLAGVAVAVGDVRPRTRRLYGAYAVGHLSHLAGDVVYPPLLGEPVEFGRVLWPVAHLEPGASHGGVVERVAVYFLSYLHQVLTGELTGLLALQVALVGGVALLWLYDGAPGPVALVRFARGH